MGDYDHLNKACIEKLGLSKNERIRYIHEPRWIGYPTVQEALKKCNDMVYHPRTLRMPNLMIIGRTNSGKTELLKKFCQLHPPKFNDYGDSVIAPTLFIEAPPSPNENDIYSEILSTLYEQIPTSSNSSRRHRTIEVLSKIKLKVLCIDELHNSLAGSTSKRQQALNTFKYLSNKLQISIIASGTEDLLRAVSIDSQIQNRFESVLIPLWQMNKGFLQLLASFETILPLKKPSHLHKPPICKKLLATCEGTLGELSSLLNKCAVYAIENEIEQITIEVINNCGYVPPSDRSREAAIKI